MSNTSFEFGDGRRLDKDLTRREFYEMASAPNALSDEMNFHLAAHPDNIEDDRSFSIEGFEALGYQMHDYALARTLAFRRREGRWPTGLRAEVKLFWDDVRDAETLARDSDEPWYQLPDPGGEVIPLDGSHRLAQFLTERREGD